MRHLVWIPVGILALAAPVIVLAGSGSGFDGVVNSIESRYHVHATRIPFVGLISLVAHKATHGGVSAVHIADRTATFPSLLRITSSPVLFRSVSVLI